MTRAGERYMESERVRVYENADGGVTYSFDEDAPPVGVEETVAAVEETAARRRSAGNARAVWGKRRPPGG